MICIIGAGIAGLTLGALLELEQIPYVIYERRPNVIVDDYALTIMSAANVISHLGIQLNGCELNCFATLDADLNYLDYNYHCNQHYTVPRNLLISKLLEQIPAGKIKWNSSPDTDADLVIIADGIRSNSRRELLGTDVVVDTGLKLKLLKIRNDPRFKPDTIYQIFLPGSIRTRVFIKPYDADYTMVQIVGPNTDLPAFLSGAECTSVYENNMLYLQQFDPPDSGKVYLLGDSLHGMVPYVGQGANLAMCNGQIMVDHIKAGTMDRYYSDILPKARAIMTGSMKRFTECHYGEPLQSANLLCMYYPPTVISSIRPSIDLPVCSYRLHQRQITSLCLSGIGLDTVPEAICRMNQLRVLSLKNNQLRQFELKLKNLKELYLCGNLLTDIDLNLDQLQVLDVSRNRLANARLELPKLVELRVSDNQLTSLTCLSPKLRKLYAERNNLRADPVTASDLKIMLI